ncbi:hypothetical protein QFC21_006505 [Naganishia friedmannii]|uniref:Uncharacterized protein n=1 Tax=Naganishia friedmannii TaxID=89922 RepID=A0ACC2V1I2_9TREE|nr:hypothetical protein QFC21_006505 [Naganishia friedmannii]
MEVDEKHGSGSRSTPINSPHGMVPERLPRFSFNGSGGEGSVSTHNPTGKATSPSYRSDHLTSPRGSGTGSQPPLDGSVLGKRRASLMEEQNFSLHEDPRPATLLSQAGHLWTGSKFQATEAAVSSVFRRESMISPVDLAPPQTRFDSLPSSPPRHLSSLGLHASHIPSYGAPRQSGTVSPTNRRTQEQSLSIFVEKVQDGDIRGVDMYHSEAEEHRPSLPGFKSLFGMVDTEERPVISRNNSSGFPDLQTLKAPLSLALGAYSATRNSNDSGTTSIWSSSRSSFGTRESISTSATTGSTGRTPFSTTPYSSFPFKPQSPGSAGSVRPPPRYQSDSGSHGVASSSHRGSISQAGTDQDMPGGNAERSGSLLLDLAKRPSYANFSAEVEKQRAEIQRQRSIAQAEEAWRRQSDNAAILSDERRRLLGSSPQPLLHRGLQESVEGPPESASQSIAEQISTLPDDAIRAARTRLLRYESYPFGSKDALSGVQDATTPTQVTDGHRRQSTFPHQPHNGIVASEMNNPNDCPTPTGNNPQNTLSVSFSGWREPHEQQHRSSTSSQRDLQFEDIVRKASVDLAKRSATSSLTGTPITAPRALILPSITTESVRRASPATPLGQNRNFDAAEAANAREREQRQDGSMQISASPSAIPSRATLRRMPSASQSRSGAVPAPFTSGYAPRHDPLPQLQSGIQETQPPSSNTDEYRRSSFQVLSDSSRPAMLGRSHSQQRYSVPMDVDQQQMSRPRRSPLPATVEQPSNSYAGPSTRHDRPYDLPLSWHRAHGAPDHDGLKTGKSWRRRSHAPVPAGNEGTAQPCFDNPELPLVVSGANNPLGFPSVLRKDHYLEGGSAPAFKVASNASGHESTAYTPPLPSHLPLLRHDGPAVAHRHRLHDTGEKPYKCTWPNCTRSFSVQSNLKRHAKVHLENGGQQATAGGNDHVTTETGSGHLAAGFPGTSTPGGPPYSTGFLTPQTAQPMPANYKPEGYFELRNIHAGQSAPHLPVPSGPSKPHPGPPHPTSTETQGYLASPIHVGNTGPRVPFRFHHATQDPLIRRASDSGAYGDPRL